MNGLRVTSLRCTFGRFVALDQLSLEIDADELRCVIGPNGAGKSTLLGAVSGEIIPRQGHIWWGADDLTRLSVPARARRGIAKSFQTPRLLDSDTVFENVRFAVQSTRSRLGRLLRRYDPEIIDRTLAILDECRLTELKGVNAETLAHGHRAWLELALVMAREPSLVLLDEPTAGMSHADVTSLREYLAGFRQNRTVVLIEHDLEFVKDVADRITVLDAGRLIVTGSPAEITADERVRGAYLEGRILDSGDIE
jgi:branched-chain amino acid transport system ATP-binding protein